MYKHIWKNFICDNTYEKKIFIRINTSEKLTKNQNNQFTITTNKQLTSFSPLATLQESQKKVVSHGYSSGQEVLHHKGTNHQRWSGQTQCQCCWWEKIISASECGRFTRAVEFKALYIFVVQKMNLQKKTRPVEFPPCLVISWITRSPSFEGIHQKCWR